MGLMTFCIRATNSRTHEPQSYGCLLRPMLEQIAGLTRRKCKYQKEDDDDRGSVNADPIGEIPEEQRCSHYCEA